ncbi:glucose 1-dehydrogenase [Nonomuraea roseoviolacea subsp. roseoviolacea]|uniref:Threonine dehydrogenase-like Zn-dependent dehydrogenase n=1 Tax=Nonomuraea roseoviolacea subsp. carminata TaxID=160689 RepID=A0ABT1JUP8_9ACTN|nr:glucose 1-dehydrogenase [Nonomuraea roseoviolacea]MCP2345473.1 threonine dehydrogenase-like Zn-dependent dehydrogenase [Nonomuraea roseoviolacea subsp. carminata]
MRALTLRPDTRGSLRVEDVPDPEPGPGELLVQGLALGICGTDRELASGEYGFWRGEQDCMVLGHESLGRVLRAPEGSSFSPGDLVVGVVRRPDPVPCPACARGEFDMCRNGRYTERGIKALDGYGSELWTVEEDYAVRIDPRLERVGMLMEPTSVVAKAWEHIERIGARSWFEPRTALVVGAGPIGLLAALLARQRGLEVHVIDRATEGLKRDLVRSLGAVFHSGSSLEPVRDLRPDIIVEATGADTMVRDAMLASGSAGIVCLTGVSPAGKVLDADVGRINRDMVLENDVVFGSVNANLRHFRAAGEALAAADCAWLERLITRRLPLERALEAFDKPGDDVKLVIDLTG